jgi:hypothetical protein
MIKYAILLTALFVSFGMNCITMSTSTGGSIEGKAESKSSVSQRDTSNNSVTLEVPPTTITLTDKSVISTGGGKASTGSIETSVDTANSKALSEIQAKVEANSSNSANIWIFALIGAVICGLLLLIKLVERKLWIFGK